jgi:hypothetical protein
MNIEQMPTLLIETGLTVIAIGILYGIQLLLDQNDSNGKDQMDKVRAYRRLTMQALLESWRRIDLDGAATSSRDFNQQHRIDALREAMRATFSANEMRLCDETDQAFQFETEGAELLQPIWLDMAAREENYQ